MNQTIHLPFIKLSLINCSKQQHFFNSLFEKTNEKYGQEYKVSLSITFNSKSLLTSNKSVLKLGEEVATDKKHFYVLDPRGRAARLDFNTVSSRNAALEVDADFDLYYLFTFILEPLLIVMSAHNDVLFIHASGIQNKNLKTVLLPAWQHTGKTHALLSLTSRGWALLGDDYCVLHQNILYPYLKAVNLFSYNFQSHPELFKSLSVSQKLWIVLGSTVQKFLQAMAKVSSGGVAKVMLRLSQLSEVATNIQLHPTALSISIGTPSKVTDLIFLQRISKEGDTSSFQQLPKKDFVTKVRKIMKYEMSGFFQLYDQYRYFFPGHKSSVLDTFFPKYQVLLKSISVQPSVLAVDQKKGDSSIVKAVS